MVAVHTTTDEYPPLREHIELRRLQGLDTYDEWWEGVYRIVTGPSPEHGELLADLAELLGPLKRAAGLRSSSPVNIGVDKENCRVPDMGFFEPDTPRTSPAFLETALLVVEVLSPGEKPKEKVDFYQAHGVKEYLEINLERSTAELWGWTENLAGTATGWTQETDSEILPGLTIGTMPIRQRGGGERAVGRLIITPEGRLDVRDYRPDA